MLSKTRIIYVLKLRGGTTHYYYVGITSRPKIRLEAHRNRFKKEGIEVLEMTEVLRVPFSDPERFETRLIDALICKGELLLNKHLNYDRLDPPSTQTVRFTFQHYWKSENWTFISDPIDNFERQCIDLDRVRENLEQLDGLGLLLLWSVANEHESASLINRLRTAVKEEPR